jgi:hypothetical protein
VTLTEEERRKFAAYCQEEALSYFGLAEQAAKLPAGEIMALPMRRNAAAYALVARHLSATEEMTLNAPPPQNHGEKR